MNAKPTLKPWYRPRNIALGFLALFLAFLCWAGYWVYWALTVEPNPSTDYAAQLEQLAREAQPPGANGWWDVMRAVSTYEIMEREFAHLESTQLSRFRFDFTVLENTQAALEQWPVGDAESLAQEARAELRRAIDWLGEQGVWNDIAVARANPNFVRPIDTGGGMLLEHPFPEFAPMRGLARARAVLFADALDANNVQGSVAALEDILTLARASSSQPMLISYLVGEAIRSSVSDRIRQRLMNGTIGDEMAVALLDALSRHPPPADVTLHLQAERLLFFDTVQWFHSDDGDGDGTLLYAKFGPILNGSGPGISWGLPNWTPITNAGGLAFASRRKVVEFADRYFNRTMTTAQQPAVERPSTLPDTGQEIKDLGWRYAFLAFFLPTVDMAYRIHDRQRLDDAGLRIELAIAAFRAHHGTPPDALSDLVPDIFSKLPDDPLGNPAFGYRRLVQDEHGRDYLLYSFGNDGVDNGGVDVDFLDREFMLRTKREHVDYVFNRYEKSLIEGVTPPAE